MLTKFLNLKIFDNHLHIFSFRTKKIGRNLEAVGAIFYFYDYVLLVKVNKKRSFNYIYSLVRKSQIMLQDETCSYYHLKCGKMLLQDVWIYLTICWEIIYDVHLYLCLQLRILICTPSGSCHRTLPRCNASEKRKTLGKI